MRTTLAEWAERVLLSEGITGWSVRVQDLARGAGACCYRTREIVIPSNAGPGIVLHECAHIGCEPGHGLDWQARLTELIDRHTVEVWTR